MKEFAERLKELRHEKGLSIEKLSKATGFSHSALVYWENEQRIPNAMAIITLAKYFGVTTDYMLGLEN